MKENEQKIYNSLTFRAVTPIIVILFLLGIGLYFFLLSSVSDFVEERIKENIKWASHDIYDFVNNSLDQLMKSGQMGDERAVRVKKGMTIGLIEDYMRDNEIWGYVFDGGRGKLVFGDENSPDLFEIIEYGTKENVVNRLTYGKKEYYTYHFHFQPWDWHIVVAEDASVYAGLVNRLRRIYLLMGSVIIVAAFILIYYFRSSIRGATKGIITPITRGQPPEYRGINEFAFMSDSIRRMMVSLRESEAKTRALIDAIPDLIFSLQGDGTITDYKPSKSVDLQTVYGNPIGKSVFDVLPRDAALQFMHSIASALSSGDVQVAEFQLTANGILRDYEARFVTGKEDEVVAIVREITEQKRAIEGLVAAEEKFRKLVEQSLVGIYIIQDGKFPYVNPTLAEICGYTQEEMISSKSVVDLAADDDRGMVLENLRKRIDGEAQSMRYGFRIKRSDGELRDVEVQGSRTMFNGKPAVIGTLLDITEGKKATELLRYSEEKYRRLFMESKDVIYITTKDGKFADVNPAGVELFGYATREELMEVDITKDIYMNSSDREKFTKAMETQGFVKDYELTLRRRDGQEVIVLVTGNVTRDGDGKIIGYRGIMRNVTEQKALEGQFLYAQKMEAVGRLAGGIAHDINNYLGAVTGFCDIVRIKHAHSDEIVEKMDSAIDSIDKASTLIKQLLAFSRMQPVKPVVVRLNDVVRKMEKMLKRIIGEDVELVTELDEDLWNVEIDPSQVEQILANLLVNSRDAMPHGGRVIIQTGNADVDGDLLKKYPKQKPGRFVYLSVSDTGIGIPVKIQDKVFEPFYTTKGRSKGSGLGLSTVYGIVKQNDGYIWIDSEPEKGATFHIYLPVCDDAAADFEEKPEEPTSMSGGSGRILVAEDNPDVRESLKAMLEMMGYTVTTASNGEEAISLFEEMGGDIDLLVADVIMPGMSGKDVAKQIRQKNQAIKVLFISGYDDSVIQDHDIEGEGVVLLQKPFPAKELAKTIQNILM
jgi:PAS domain S-box-containing protein